MWSLRRCFQGESRGLGRGRRRGGGVPLLTSSSSLFHPSLFLLQDAGLDAQERNVTQTALQAAELRAQWPDADLQCRDLRGALESWTKTKDLAGHSFAEEGP